MRQTNRMTLPVWLAAGPLVLGFSSCGEGGTASSTEKSTPPNIVLIVSDDQGYNDIGVYGGSDIQTPWLDRLASEGARFTNFYVTCSGCTPSRGSLFTGRYPQRNGTFELFRNNRINDGHIYEAYEYSTSPEMILGMDEREVLFPQLLKQAGYTNGIFGKWDLGQLKRFLPLQRGFDRYYGFSNTGIDYYTHERYFVPSMYRDNERTEEDKGTYTTYLFEREALKFVRENHEQPFLLYIPYNAPHSASSLDPEVKGTVQAPPEYLAMYPEGTSPQDKKRRGYKAAVTCMDNSIGNVLQLIDSLNLTDNTIVIFFSDNGGGGGSDNAPLKGGKATMWEGGVRVPCIVKWPGKVEQGRVIDNFVSSLEIFPTVLEITGLQKPEDVVLDGFSMVPLLTGEDNNLERTEMYWEFREEYAARVGDWKWLRSDRRNHKGLYDLATDVGEKTDLSETNMEQNRIMEEKFAQWQQAMNEAEPRGPFKDY